MNFDPYAYLIPALISASGYFLSRAVARVDSLTKNSAVLNEEIGKLKMINEAQWRNIDDLKVQLRDLSRK
jgi:cell division protein FtsB